MLSELENLTLWLEPDVLPDKIKANSPITHHPIPRVNIQVLKNTSDKKTGKLCGNYGLIA